MEQLYVCQSMTTKLKEKWENTEKYFESLCFAAIFNVKC